MFCTFQQIGENIVLRRGVTFTCNKSGFTVTGLTHPSSSATAPNRISYGRYGTFMAYAKVPDSGIIPEGQTEGNKCPEASLWSDSFVNFEMVPKSLQLKPRKSSWPAQLFERKELKMTAVKQTDWGAKNLTEMNKTVKITLTSIPHKTTKFERLVLSHLH